MYSFLSALPRLRHLRVLGLARVEATAAATAAIFDTLATASTAPDTLARVDVSGNTAGAGKAGWCCFRGTHRLTLPFVRSCYCAGYDGTAALCRWLTADASAPLTHLAVARCGLAVESLFAAWPKIACRLEVLDISGNVLGRTVRGARPFRGKSPTRNDARLTGAPQGTASTVSALLESPYPRALVAGAMVTNAVAYEQMATAMGFAPSRPVCEVRAPAAAQRDAGRQAMLLHLSVALVTLCSLPDARSCRSPVPGWPRAARQ